METNMYDDGSIRSTAEYPKEYVGLVLQQDADSRLREQRPRVAIVDDEPLIRELLAENLHEMGYDIAAFACAQAALEALRFAAFDVILCDIRMPGMNGAEFYAHVLKRDRQQAARILFLTGDLAASKTQAFLSDTGSLYLSKPFRQSELRAKLKELSARCSPDEAANIVAKAA